MSAADHRPASFTALASRPECAANEKAPENRLVFRGFVMVGVARIELATPAMSTQRGKREWRKTALQNAGSHPDLAHFTRFVSFFTRITPGSHPDGFPGARSFRPFTQDHVYLFDQAQVCACQARPKQLQRG
ncbi:hypothetical protein [Sphingomonas sp. LHG3406-1]|uniref:hypothetical protein n=1 Tax=Sphingomonas sp. LHG3406-1 TaxID=2804617 RepID=UPI002624C336|nr:hypothetical protein [Sphingomonas sp. LHG3406-1]